MITGKCCSIHYISREDCHTPYFNPKSLIIHWKALSEEEKTRLTIFKGQCFKEHLHNYLIKNNLCHRCYDNVFNQLRSPSEMLRSLITISNKIILNYDELHEEYLLSLLIKGDESLDIEPDHTRCPNSNTIEASTEYVIDVISILYKENLDISYSIAFDKSLKMRELLLEEINKSESSIANKKKRRNRNKKKKVKNASTTTATATTTTTTTIAESESEKVKESETNKLKSNNNNNINKNIKKIQSPTPPPSTVSQSIPSSLTPTSSHSTTINKKNHSSKLSQSTNVNSTTTSKTTVDSSSTAATHPPRENSADYEDDTSDSEVESFKALLQTIHQQRPSKKIEVKNNGET